MSTRQLIEKELDALPESLQQEVYDFACFLRRRVQEERFNGLLLSESALGKERDDQRFALVGRKETRVAGVCRAERQGLSEPLAGTGPDADDELFQQRVVRQHASISADVKSQE